MLQKTAGILGDDLAVNAEKATGFLSSRELPILWAITKGSFINKLIILPVVFLLNYFFPVLITIILVLGGIYLAYEGAEKIVEFIFHRSKKGHEVLQESVLPDVAENSEKSKISSAIKTDFILSLEIVIIALATVIEHEHPLLTQILSVSFVAIIATIGVYGIVALIVRMDDAGYFLIKKSDDKGLLSVFGQFLVKALPMIIKILSVVGTIALLLVSGGIFVHNIDFFHHLFPTVPSIVKDFGFGLIVGLLTVGIVMVFKSLFSAVKK